jgi:hypothetical protein
MLILFLNQNSIKGTGTPIQPIERKVGRLNISIDPRMELLSTIQLLSNYYYISRDIPYSEKIISSFSSFKKHDAVKMTDKLCKEYGFSYDSPILFILHLSQPPELKQNMFFSHEMIEEVDREENLDLYRKAVKDFAEKSKFEMFWHRNISYYNQILDMSIAEIDDFDWIQCIESYYNESHESYNIIISPALRGGFGPQITDNNGRTHIYACLSGSSTKNNISYLNNEDLLYYIWHEFGHSYVNPLTEKYAERVAVSEKLLEPILAFMEVLKYPEWKICVNEHIIRAIYIRLLELYQNEAKAKETKNNELKNYFIYIEPLIEKLKEFEKQRDNNNITFSSFYPELLNLLDSLEKVEYWKEKIKVFNGPINAVQKEEKIAYIYSTQDQNKRALKTVQEYSLEMFNQNAKPTGWLYLSDTTALKTDLSEYGIFAYGTIESNMFLKQHAALFPFKIINHTIHANRKYKGKYIKFVSCVPNPLNPKKGMVIYTAPTNNAIKGFNIKRTTRLELGDYIIFIKKNYLSNGIYKKNEKWEF